MKHNLEESLLNSEKIFQGDFIEVVRDKVLLPDSKQATREYIKHPGAAAIIAITKDRQIVLEYQYRHPIKKIVLEIPAGKLNKDEDPLLGAQRELLEETGYSSKRWISLGECYPCIGYSDEKIVYYLALDVEPGPTNLDDGEFVEVTTLDVETCFKFIYNNTITDAKSIAGLMLYHGYLLG